MWAKPRERGDAVWLHNPQRKKGLSPKLQRPWQGPYLVLKRINDVIYRIQLGPSIRPKVVHSNRLWKYRGADPPGWLSFLLKEPSLPSVRCAEKETAAATAPTTAPREDSVTTSTIPNLSAVGDPERTSPEPDATAGPRRSVQNRRSPDHYAPTH